jgi:flagellar biosynthesis/type III secretory pathway chaperone
MNAPAMPDQHTSLATALIDVHATLQALLAASDEQYAALADGDLARVESVTRQQEQLAARLERVERKRAVALDGQSLTEALAQKPNLARLNNAIADKVRELQAKHAQSASLIEKATELNAQTLQFLHSLVDASNSTTYGARGATKVRQSVLVDRRA